MVKKGLRKNLKDLWIIRYSEDSRIKTSCHREHKEITKDTEKIKINLCELYANLCELCGKKRFLVRYERKSTAILGEKKWWCPTLTKLFGALCRYL